MSRPKGSKNKAKAPETKNMTKEETTEWYNKAAERIKEKYSSEYMEIVKNVQFVTPGFTEEMAPKGKLLMNIQKFCEKKGFPPSELIEKFESLETFYEKFKNINMGQTQSVIHLQDMPIPHLSQNKPNTAPNPEKEGKTTPKQEKGKEGAENDIENDWIDEAGGVFNAANVLRQQENAKKPPKPESKPKELSPFLKSRQALKNGQK